MHLYVTRHGQTDWNAEKRIQGHTDIPLNSLGIEQAEILRDELADTHFDQIFCSPLSRAHQTAQIISAKHEIEPIFDDRIKEGYFGKLEGETPDTDLIDFDIQWTPEMLEPFEVETNDHFFDRVANFIDEIAEKYEDKDVLIVSHSGAYRHFYQYFNGKVEFYWDVPPLHNCEYIQYTIHNMGLQDKYFNFIKSGTKRLELRLFDEKRRKIQIGDLIRFKNSKDEVLRCKVEALHIYPSFAKLFEDFPTEMLADKSISKEEMLEIMSEFYPEKRQKETGVVGIQIRPLK
jgi:broad specificity phosphatase PhoE